LVWLSLGAEHEHRKSFRRDVESIELLAATLPSDAVAAGSGDTYVPLRRARDVMPSGW
jgi:hypothetical protein